MSIDGSISSQFLTAFLMSAPLAEGEVRIKIEGDLVSKPYIDITLHIMKQFGVEVINNDYQELLFQLVSTMLRLVIFLWKGMLRRPLTF